MKKTTVSRLTLIAYGLMEYPIVFLCCFFTLGTVESGTIIFLENPMEMIFGRLITGSLLTTVIMAIVIPLCYALKRVFLTYEFERKRMFKTMYLNLYVILFEFIASLIIKYLYFGFI